MGPTSLMHRHIPVPCDCIYNVSLRWDTKKEMKSFSLFPPKNTGNEFHTNSVISKSHLEASPPSTSLRSAPRVYQSIDWGLLPRSLWYFATPPLSGSRQRLITWDNCNSAPCDVNTGGHKNMGKHGCILMEIPDKIWENSISSTTLTSLPVIFFF